MNKFLIFFGMILFGSVSQSYAATFDLGLIEDTKGFSNTIPSKKNLDVFFTDTWNFSTPTSANSAAISITNVSIKFFSIISDFAAKFDGDDLQLSKSNASGILVSLLSGGKDISTSNHS